MNVSPRVFISFSSRDKTFARKLFFRLKSLNANVWDYSERGSEIPWGSKIPDVLQKRIDDSDYFIPILSPNSMDPLIGRFTLLEIEYARSRGMDKHHRILPIVLPGELSHWDGPCASIKNIRHLDIDPDNRKQFEEIIVHLSEYLNIPYIPLFVAHGRFPFSEKFDFGSNQCYENDQRRIAEF